MCVCWCVAAQVYREDMYLWEVYLKLKKCLVLSAVTFFGDSVPCQALLALLVLVASMIISRQLPFRYSRNNVLQVIMSTSLISSPPPLFSSSCA